MPADIQLIDDLVDFIRGRGYVLDFSDRSMRHFFGVMDIDIDAPAYAVNGPSKGNRLRTFLKTVDDPTAIRVLQAIWQHRVDFLASTGRDDPVASSRERFLALIGRLTDLTVKSGLPPMVPPKAADSVQAELQSELLRIRDLPPQPRGYAFERFLTRAFEVGGMAPREPFNNSGEQIDGSFLLDGEVYLVEAKWRDALTNAQDLNAFHGKLEGKAAWARGLFVSFNGFTPQALGTFHGRRAILMEGRDIHDGLARRIPLMSLLRAKVRAAGETGKVFVPVSSLFS